MSRATLEVADIIRAAGDSFWEKHGAHLAWPHRKVLDAMVRCRTAVLGGHRDQCVRCGHQAISFNSCRNRHCTKCQGNARAKWLQARSDELLPVPYFHVVFTLPHELSALALGNKRLIYDLLYRASSEAMLEMARDPEHLGAEIGFLGVLHTWGQAVEHHPHVHYIVPAGGLAPDGSRWIGSSSRFFLPVKALGRFFRGKLIAGLLDLYQRDRLQFHGSLMKIANTASFSRFLQPLRDKDWVVYAKPPFGGPEQVLKYLARYTHRVAISNYRLVGFRDGQVSFLWRDYLHGGKQKVMTISAHEFLRRFLLHVLPAGLVRIRHFGLFANRKRGATLVRCRFLLGATASTDPLPTPQPRCPSCLGVMLIVERLSCAQLYFRLPVHRWIAPIELSGNANGAAERLTQPDGRNLPAARNSPEEGVFGAEVTPSGRQTFVRIGMAISGVALLAGAMLYVSRSRRVVVRPADVKQRQLTTNSHNNPVSANAISPDGKYLAHADVEGLHIKLMTTGEVRDVPNPPPYEKSYVGWGIPQNWLPDGTRFLVNTGPPYQPTSTWVVSVLGSWLRKIQDGFSPWSISSDGKIAYTTQTGRMGDHEIWVSDDVAQNPHKLFSGDEDSSFSMLVWSPDNRRIAYIRDHYRAGMNETSIELIDLRTSAPATLVPSDFLRDLSRLPSDQRSLVWLPDGRIVYSTGVRDTNGFSCNYWQLRVDASTGVPLTKPQRMTSWAGFCLLNVGATEDGRKLVFQKATNQRRVFVADFDSKARKITTPTLLTDQEGREFPTAWTRDSEEVVFASNRDGGWQLLRQKFGAERAELIASGLTDIADQTPVAPDGSSFLNVAGILAGQQNLQQLLRIPLSGGAPETVAIGGAMLGVRCSRSSAIPCVLLEESPDHKQFVFSKLDPLQGRGSELARIDREDIAADYEWALSPDGMTIALARQFDETIRLIPLNGQIAREVHAKGWRHLRNITFTADGQGFFASHPSRRGAVLLHVNLDGAANVLWELAGYNVYLRGIPSPDGRHVAILGSSSENNVWMMENF